jgi:hypothetical protein
MEPGIKVLWPRYITVTDQHPNVCMYLVRVKNVLIILLHTYVPRYVHITVPKVSRGSPVSVSCVEAVEMIRLHHYLIITPFCSDFIM